MKNVQNLPIISSKRTYKKALPFFETGEPSDYDDDFDVFRKYQKYDSDELYSFESSSTDVRNRPDDTISEDRRVYGLFINEETGPDRDRKRVQISPASSQASIFFDGISPLTSLENINIPQSLLLQIMGEKDEFEYEYEEDEEEKERRRNKKPKEKKRKRKRRERHRYVPPEEREERKRYWEEKQRELDKLRAKMLEKQRKKKEKLLGRNDQKSHSQTNDNKDESNSQVFDSFGDGETNTEIFIDIIEASEKKNEKSPFANREFLYIDDVDSPGALRKAKENDFMKGTENYGATKRNMNNTKDIFQKSPKYSKYIDEDIVKGSNNTTSSALSKSSSHSLSSKKGSNSEHNSLLKNRFLDDDSEDDSSSNESDSENAAPKKKMKLGKKINRNQHKKDLFASDSDSDEKDKDKMKEKIEKQQMSSQEKENNSKHEEEATDKRNEEESKTGSGSSSSNQKKIKVIPKSEDN